MAGETLKTAAELLADYADNQAGLILPLNVRNHLIADGNDIGFVADSGPFVGTTTATYQSILGLMPSPTFAGRFWELAPGNLLRCDFAPVLVEPGTQRLYQSRMLGVVQKGAVQADVYEFAIFEDGVQVSLDYPVTLEQDAATTVFAVASRLYEPGNNPELDVRWRGVGTLDALTFDSVSFTVTGVLL